MKKQFACTGAAATGSLPGRLAAGPISTTWENAAKYTSHHGEWKKNLTLQGETINFILLNINFQTLREAAIHVKILFARPALAGVAFRRKVGSPHFFTYKRYP